MFVSSVPASIMKRVQAIGNDRPGLRHVTDQRSTDGVGFSPSGDLDRNRKLEQPRIN